MQLGTTVAQMLGMVESLFLSTNYEASKVMLDVAAKRHEVMAGNLANVDTPGYQRLDIDTNFRTQLEDSIRNRDFEGISSVGAPEISPEEGLKASRPDGNNVQLERELMLINHNALEYQAMAQFVSSSLTHLKTAITGRTQ